MAHEQLKGRAQLDWLRVLAVLIRKYGTEDPDGDRVVVVTRADLHAPPRGGLERDMDPDTGDLTYRFKFDRPVHAPALCAVCGRMAPLVDDECPDCRH